MDMFWRWYVVIGIIEFFLLALTLGNTQGGRDFWKTLLFFNICALAVTVIIIAFAWGLSGILGC
jgi:ABC-type sugar transport system permease subunit